MYTIKWRNHGEPWHGTMIGGVYDDITKAQSEIRTRESVMAIRREAIRGEDPSIMDVGCKTSDRDYTFWIDEG